MKLANLTDRGWSRCNCSAWEAWGKHVELEVGEMEMLFAHGDARPADEILGLYIKRLVTSE
jgi:hypothetical protein